MFEYLRAAERTKTHVNRYTGMEYADFSLPEAIHWVGGNLIGLGDLCLSFLKMNGLEKHHTLLDVGVGCFRCSIPIVEYLDKDCYFAIEGDAGLLKVGLDSIPEQIKESKNLKTAVSWNWEFNLLNQSKFDFIFSQGVICHTPEEEVRSLMKSIGTYLGDKAFISFIEGKRTDSDPYFWEVKDLENFTQGTGLKIEEVVGWGHPRNLKMCKLVRGEDVHNRIC